jgi:hypothetical protein
MRKERVEKEMKKKCKKNRDMLSWGQPKGDYCFFLYF